MVGAASTKPSKAWWAAVWMQKAGPTLSTAGRDLGQEKPEAPRQPPPRQATAVRVSWRAKQVYLIGTGAHQFIPENAQPFLENLFGHAAQHVGS